MPVTEVSRRSKLILEVVPGERRLLPAFGCRIHSLPSLGSAASRHLAAALVEEALERWAPDLDCERAEVGEASDSGVSIRILARGGWHQVLITHRHPGAGEEEGES